MGNDCDCGREEHGTDRERGDSSSHTEALPVCSIAMPLLQICLKFSLHTTRWSLLVPKVHADLPASQL